MALTESRFRQILKEEARRVLREGTGKVATMDAAARALRNMENPEADDLADKIERYNRSHGGTTSIEFDERDDGTVKAYEREGSRTGNYMFDIPDDIYKELRSSLSDRLSERRSRRALRESEDEEMDDGGEYEDEEMTVQGIIDRYKDEGPRSWMRVSNDFREMADGGMEDIREKYYPGLTPDDCATIADELDRHFGMD